MSDQFSLKRIRVKNYRCLADLSLDLEPINVLFGPNGAGKSTLLDTLWFVHDCAVRDVPEASAQRSHGIGLLNDRVKTMEPMEIELATGQVEYQLKFNLYSGRIEPFFGEYLQTRKKDKVLIERTIGATVAEFYQSTTNQIIMIPLRDSGKLSLNRYLDFEPDCDEANELDLILRSVQFYHSRSFNFQRLKALGSETGYEALIRFQAENLWSVLRNIEGRRQLDDRYSTIMNYMSEAFPDFKGLVIEATGPSSLYASFIEKYRRGPIPASGISDGHLQMLILLTILFSEGRERYSLILLDEPETSLHPWALAVLARAIKNAAEEWGKQIILATHSPVLMSQFELSQNLAVETRDGQTHITRLSAMEGIQDDLEHYASGSLYMSETIAPQSGNANLSISRTEP